MGRRPKLDARSERDLAALLAAGVRQDRIAVALDVSTRTIQRHLAQRRREATPATLDEELARVPSLADTLADSDRPRPKTRRSRRSSRTGWQQAAAELEQVAPERWLTG
jgi:hypothetical protein